MTRYFSKYRNQETRNTGSGFSGFESVGSPQDSSTRYEFSDNTITSYIAAWLPVGQGFGWTLFVVDQVGDLDYSPDGELLGHSFNRITVKTYSYYKPNNVGKEFAYSMVFDPSYDPEVDGENSHAYASLYDAIYEEDGDYQRSIDGFLESNSSAVIGDLYDKGNRQILASSEEGFKTGFQDGWWNDAALKLNPEVSKVFSGSSNKYEYTALVLTSTWSDSVRINLDKAGTSSDSVIQAKQVDKTEYDSGFVGSIVTGTSSNDIIRGLAGFDQLTGKAGDDLIHGGNGRDIIDGGSGSDELHGDFGWNTYKDQQDGSKDLIAIKSDQHLSNFWYGKAGNSPNGEKADFIEGLDAIDEIKIIGVSTSDISVADNVSARGVTGIGIYAKGILEAVYTGGNLSTTQIQSMTTGDASAQAMNNQMWSYWGDNTVPDLLA